MTFSHDRELIQTSAPPGAAQQPPAGALPGALRCGMPGGVAGDAVA